MKIHFSIPTTTIFVSGAIAAILTGNCDYLYYALIGMVLTGAGYILID